MSRIPIQNYSNTNEQENMTNSLVKIQSTDSNQEMTQKLGLLDFKAVII